ncbi:MAG: rod-binding protein [Defluviitaleaceae bacterium]|nr:rod-binding protein [Defluviitaleaceae bacterium]
MDIAGVAGLGAGGVQNSALEHARRDSEMAQFQGILESMIAERDNPLGTDRAQMRQAAEMFEAYFLQMMFRQMRSVNFNEDGLFSRSHAEQIFTEMLDETISDKAASQGGFGLADMLYAQMTRHLN